MILITPSLALACYGPQEHSAGYTLEVMVAGPGSPPGRVRADSATLDGPGAHVYAVVVEGDGTPRLARVR